MYCWSQIGGKMKYQKSNGEDGFKYFTSEDELEPVTRNEFLQDFVILRLSELGEEIIAGKELSVQDITSRISKDVVEFSSKTKDKTLNAKALLLSAWFNANYSDDDSVIDDVEDFECIEAEIYSGMNNVLKVKAENGN